MLEELSITPLEFSPHEPLSHYINTTNDSELILTKDKEEFKNSIKRYFPNVKKESLEKLIRLSMDIDKEISSMKHQNQGVILKHYFHIIGKDSDISGSFVMSPLAL